MLSIRIIRVLCFVTLAIYQAAYAMEAPQTSHTLVDTISAYNPVNACLRRTPFAWCILKAAYNTATCRSAPVWHPDTTQLPDAPALAKLFHNSLIFRQHIKPEQFLWGVGHFCTPSSWSLLTDSCSWHVGKFNNRVKKYKNLQESLVIIGIYIRLILHG